MPISFTLGLSAAIFLIGVLGVMIRRDPVVMFICIEMMFNAANLGFVALSNYFHMVDGQVLVFLVVAVAAAEVAVGLAIIIAIFRNEEDVDIDRISSMKG